MTPEEAAKFDQAASHLADTFPTLWRRMYLEAIRVGFTESESLKLVQTYILSHCPHGVRGDDG